MVRFDDSVASLLHCATANCIFCILKLINVLSEKELNEPNSCCFFVVVVIDYTCLCDNFPNFV